ncbi:hypothetical protein PHET_09160 [Paragonimus heterotremus]|uniref:Uncharacterized protein n=1 Tax=Paragonimus heterotremus TaxID=100268 RepID=A0A8J4WNK0_9TREM|nr:hypothetical protein PHET_09160 [Paragonimus heterotremus]
MAGYNLNTMNWGVEIMQVLLFFCVSNAFCGTSCPEKLLAVIKGSLDYATVNTDCGGVLYLDNRCTKPVTATISSR